MSPRGPGSPGTHTRVSPALRSDAARPSFNVTVHVSVAGALPLFRLRAHLRGSARPLQAQNTKATEATTTVSAAPPHRPLGDVIRPGVRRFRGRHLTQSGTPTEAAQMQQQEHRSSNMSPTERSHLGSW